MQKYCDYNATTPLLQPVKEAMIEALNEGWGNSFSPHALGRKASSLVEEARAQVAKLMSVQSSQVRFTSGASESNAWVLRAFATKGPILCSAVEHPSVLAYATHTIPVDSSGRIDLEALREQIIAHRPALVSVMAANNETGVVQPIEAVYCIAKELGVPYHCDASQVIGKLNTSIKADFITLSAHKFGGPKGVGALILNSEIPSLLLGGPQERGSRAGTHNVVGIVGMGVAASFAPTLSFPDLAPLEELVSRFGGNILGKDVPRLPNTICALFDQPGDMIVMSLDLHGIQASTGSACSSGASKESHVLTSMGYKGTPVRISFGPKTDIEQVSQGLAMVLESLEGL